MYPKHFGLAGALLLAPLALSSAPAPASGQSTGSIAGIVEVKEAPARRTLNRYGGSGAAREVQSIPPVVYLEGRIGDPGRSAPALTMAQEDTAFAPPLLVVPVGATVAFPNHDGFFHNVFSYSRAGRFDLGRYPRGESKDVTLDQPGIVKVYCEVHESMRAAIVVVENRYWAEPDADGAFRIDGIPPGTYTLVAWHADGDEVEREVRVSAGEVTRVEIDL